MKWSSSQIKEAARAGLEYIREHRNTGLDLNALEFAAWRYIDYEYGWRWGRPSDEDGEAWSEELHKLLAQEDWIKNYGETDC